MKQGGPKASGFTIVEVLIVLAVTSVMFVSAALLVNGRQNQTEFMTGINDAFQQVQQIINETQSGYYGPKFNCQGHTDGSLPDLGGANGGCIYLGNVIQFGTDTDSAQLITYPVVGNQFSTPGGIRTEVQDLSQAAPIAGYSAGGDIDATTAYQLPFGISVVNGPVTTNGAIGIITSLASYTKPNGVSCEGLCSGSQQFQAYAINGSGPDSLSKSGMADRISNAGAAPGKSFVPLTSNVTICLDSAGTSQSGLITIDKDSLAVTLQIIGQNKCVTS